MPRLHRVSAIVLLTIVSVSFFVASPTFARPKTDEVILLNGDHVTCEIKELKRGKLKIKTDSMGTVDVEWEDVVGVKSEFYYRVETAEGRRFYGALSMFKGDKKLQVVGLTTAVSLTQDRVVEITPIRRTFWAAIDGNFSIGFDFNKAGNQAQLTLDWRTPVPHRTQLLRSQGDVAGDFPPRHVECVAAAGCDVGVQPDTQPPGLGCRFDTLVSAQRRART